MGAFSNFWIQVLEPVLLMSCLDALSKLMKIQEFHMRRAMNNHKFTGKRTSKLQVLRVIRQSQETQFGRYRRRMLLEVEQQNMDILKQSRVLPGCWQDGSGFAFYVIVLSMHGMVQCIMLNIRIQFYQLSWQCSLVTRHDIKGIPFQNMIQVNIQIYFMQIIIQYQLYIILIQYILSLEENQIYLIAQLPKRNNIHQAVNANNEIS
ncbi:hypothetical protein SS50377_21565 [Spironucleus salmonicida]|uniref:Uncharacterized protein n=1 Tax=Spironucleus salmonicida TaxID=348837 RepID=A0A9P8LY15_9EUKA|nr:hypothetical protein SS50377_21565 [Spironucleus salmonicida]